jgi:hypothetical protein
LIEEAEREGYARGYGDAIAAVTAAAVAMNKPVSPVAAAESRTPQPNVVVGRQRGRPAKAIGLVQEVIATKPGLQGVQIVSALKEQLTPVNERTVRSCLRRLKQSRVIWQRKGRWYPRPKEHSQPQIDFGEVLRAAPPH